MSTEDTLRQQAFVILPPLRSGTEDVVRLSDALEAIAAEREACAQVAYNFPTMHGFHSCYGVADAIRNRAAEMNKIRSRQEPQE